MTELTIIAACDNNNGIGYQGSLPWNIPRDLEFVKKLSLGKCILMGRKSFESLGRPLPMRRNIVLSRKKRCVPGIEIIDNINKLEILGEPELMIFGGQEVYELTLPLANKIILTRVHGEFKVDRFFPIISPVDFFCEKQVFYPEDENNLFALTFQFYIRK